MPLTIGAAAESGLTRWQGAIDFVKVYKKSLTDAQIQKMTSEGNTGSFTVPANSETGVAFTSPSSTKPLQCSFTASGLVDENGQNPYIGPAGLAGYYLSAFRLPSAPMMAFIAKRSNDVYEFVGENATLQLAPNEQISFYQNDAAGSHFDNSGQFDVTYTCLSLIHISEPTRPY